MRPNRPHHRFSRSRETLFNEWHDFPPRWDEDWAEVKWSANYGYMGRAVRLDYSSDKIINAGDTENTYHGYKHDFDQSAKPCDIWMADDPNGEPYPSVAGLPEEAIVLGYALRIDWEDPTGDVYGQDFADRSAYLLGIDRSRFAIMVKRTKELLILATNTMVTPEGIDDRR